MLKKQYTNVFYTFCVLLIILTVALFYRNINGIFDFIIMALLIYAALFAFIVVVGTVYSNKILKILTDECDPERYLAEHDCFHIGSGKRKGHPIHHANRYAAFVNMGRFDEARIIMETLPSPESIKKPFYDALYYVNSAHLSIIDGNYEEARKKLAYVRNIKLPKKIQSILINCADANEAEILRKQGYLTESRRIFNDVMLRETQKYHLLAIVFYLGLIDIEEQAYDEAEKAFKRVIQEGNKLYIVTLAKQELKKIGR